MILFVRATAYVLPPLQAQDAMGTLNLKGILDLKDSGIDIQTLLSLDKRTDLYTKEVGALPGPV